MQSSFSLVARGLARSRGAQVVLDGVDVDVGPGTRLGVVGPNGVGKTTLLRLLAGVDTPDRGTVVRTPPSLRVGFLPQEPERSAVESLRAFLARRTGVTAAEVALATAAEELAAATPGADDSYARALEDYLASGAPDLDARAGAVCDDLGVPVRLLDLPTDALSGGQAARASLAAVLLSRFDVFLLDEPTNDLDFAGLDRIERFLGEVGGGFVVVSHDREFLDRVVTSVVEIDEHSRRSTEFAGGWQAYLDARATERRHAEERYATYRGARTRLEDRSRTQREWAVQGVRRAKKGATDPDKIGRNLKIARSEQQAAKARITERALERLEEVEKPWEGWDLRLEFAAAPRSGAVVARLAGAEVVRGTFVLGPVDLEIGWGERVAIVGPNGSGKSTLLLALLGRLPLEAGQRWVGPGAVIGELDQARRGFEGGEGSAATLLEAFVGETGMTLSDARSRLAKLGLGAEEVARPAAALSPGERTRAVLAQFAAQGVNCLVLDEPTNHLDLPAIEQLEQALDSFPGTILLVTHDRRLLEAMHVTRTISVENGAVAP
jgi:ATPase subunit of ABC transporter with duplicated ATPase domains